MKKNLLLLLFVTTLFFPAVSIHAIVPVATAKASVTEPDPAAVKAAVNAFKSLSKKERKARIKEANKEIKNYNAEKKKSDPVTSTLLLVIIAILLPPLAVYLHEGEINSKFWIDLLLTLLFYVPGLIYALIVILNKD